MSRAGTHIWHVVACCVALATGVVGAQVGAVIVDTPSEAIAVLVELTGAPAAQVYANTMGPSATVARRAAAVSAARAQITLNRQQQLTFAAALRSSGLSTRSLYNATKAVNGQAFLVDDASAIQRLRSLPGVKEVHIIEPEFPSLSNSVPFIGAPAAWSGANPLGATGQGVRMGIIDSGVDYQHATFGGTGVLADYQANNRTVAPDTFFPNARVVGGRDFAGDAYTGDTVPVPDNDPMDCGGHGTHVASTAAGGGVNADSTPYSGAYDVTTPFSSLKLGPGVAPRASVYALRVFGCAGSTRLTIQAIEWAVDPNNDDDLSDHLDVINMSLGSSYGSLASTTAIASDNAARMGVIVVASAGNAGDTYTISGSPGSGQRVIATAATSDGAAPAAGLRVNAPSAIAGVYVVGQSAMTSSTMPGETTAAGSGQTGTVVLALDESNTSGSLTTDGCTALTNAAAISGNIALIDRGTCGFGIKYANARDAGAIGVIIANTSTGAFGNLGGTFVGQGSIPVLMATFADGNNIKTNIGAPVNATFVSIADTIATFSSRGPRGGGGFSGIKPDLAAPGLAITAAQTGVTCTSGGCQTPHASGFLAGNQNLVLQGTSMAAPHVAGMMALLVERYPDRSIEEHKAVAMNTSLHDVYQLAGNTNRVGVDRVGAGRIDPVKALQATVAAFNADEAGAVSLAFFGEVVGTQSQSKRVRIVNYGATEQTFSLAFDIANDAPGIAFSLPGGSSVTIPAGGTAFVNVQVDGTASLMNHVRDVTADATQTPPGSALSGLGALPRHYLTNKNGYLNLDQGAGTVLRVPVYAALRPASNMAAAPTITTGASPTGSTTIALSGADVCTGTLAAGPTCTGTFPVTDVSLVSPFELQAVGPIQPTIPPYTNIRHVGVSYDAAAELYQFAITTWGDWASPSDVAFNVFVDNNEDNVYDRILFNTNAGALAALTGTVGATGQDSFVNAVVATSGSVFGGGAGLFVNRYSAASANSVPFGNNVIILAATGTQLGLAVGDTTFRYKVQSCFGSNPTCGRIAGARLDEVTGPLSWDSAAQGLNFGGRVLSFDLNGATLPVTWNTANMTANSSLGALLLHHHNTTGNRAQVVTLDSVSTADLAITQSLTPATPTQGQNVTVTLTASNNGSSAATDVAVGALLPAGLTYVSDSGAGAYTSGTGKWNVGSLANAASATLDIVAMVTGFGPITMTSQISGSPSDPVAGNNTASNTVTVAAQTAIALTNTLTTAGSVMVGDSSSFIITVSNTGIDTLLNVSVAANRSPSATITVSTASTGSFNNATGVWTIPSIASGVKATLSFTLTTPNMAGQLTVTADATAENAPAAQRVASVLVNSPALVSATKSVTGTTFAVGSVVTYTVTLSNSAVTAQINNPGDEFTDVLPATLTLVSAAASSGTATATVGTNTVTWNGEIAGSGNVTITITATINAGNGGQTISNQGTASYDADGNGINEATALTDDPSVAGASDPTVFDVLHAEVSATMTVALTGVSVGSSATYTIILSNTGNATTPDNPGDELTDVLPAGLTLVNATASSGTLSSSTLARGSAIAAQTTVSWNGSIPAGGTVTINLTTEINSAAAGKWVSNQATFAYDADLNGSNESTGVTDDPAVTGAANATAFNVAALSVPTLSSMMFLALMLLLLAWGLFVVKRRLQH